jgi:hypothetical protein
MYETGGPVRCWIQVWCVIMSVVHTVIDFIYYTSEQQMRHHLYPCSICGVTVRRVHLQNLIIVLLLLRTGYDQGPSYIRVYRDFTHTDKWWVLVNAVMNHGVP